MTIVTKPVFDSTGAQELEIESEGDVGLLETSEDFRVLSVLDDRGASGSLLSSLENIGKLDLNFGIGSCTHWR